MQIIQHLQDHHHDHDDHEHDSVNEHDQLYGHKHDKINEHEHRYDQNHDHSYDHDYRHHPLALIPNLMEPTTSVKLIPEQLRILGFNMLAALIEKADLTESLKNLGPFTVFAPTDKAFSKFIGMSFLPFLIFQNHQKH